MTLPPFLLDEWLDQNHAAIRPSSSISAEHRPVWTLRELLSLSGDPEALGVFETLLDTNLLYTPPPEPARLREAMPHLRAPTRIASRL